MPTYYASDLPSNQSTSTLGGIGEDIAASGHGALAGLGFLGAAGANALGIPGAGGMAAYGAEQQATQQGYEAQAASAVPQNMDDVHGPADLLKFAAGQVAESAPMLAEMGVGAVLGGIPDVALAGGSIAARAAARAGVSSLIERGVQSGLTREAAEAAAGKVIARQVGAAAATYPGSVGQNLQTQYNASSGTQSDLGSAAAMGVPEAVLNTLAPEGRMARFAGIPVGTAGSRLGNMATSAIGGAIEQAGVGAGQAFIQQTQQAAVNPNIDVLSSETAKAMGQGAEAGAVVGGLIEGGRGFLHSPTGGNAGGTSSRDNAPYDGQKLYTTNAELDLQGGQGVRPGQTATTGPGLRPKLVENAQAGSAGPSVQDAIDGLQQMHSDLSDQLKQLVTTDQQGANAGQIKATTDQIGMVEKHLQVLGATPDKTAQASLDFNTDVNAKTQLTPQGTVLFQDPTGGDPLRAAQSIATSSSAPTVPPVPHPEPVNDTQAQINAIHDQTSAKDSALITQHSAPVNTGTLPSVQTPHGQFVSSNPDKIAQARAGVDRNGMGRLLGYTMPQEASDGTIVQALDAHGNVVHEEATNQQALPQARLTAQAMAPRGGSVRVTTAPEALARRGNLIAAQQAAVRPGFALQGHPTPQFEAPAQPAPPPVDLEHPGQMTLPGVRQPGENPPPPERPTTPGAPSRTNTQLADALAAAQKNREVEAAHGALANRKMGEVEASGAEAHPGALPGPQDTWQTRARIAWKDMSDGSLQGFHKAMAGVLEADTPEEAAARIRDKADNAQVRTSFDKLDAVHRAITGNTIEEGAADESRTSSREAAAPAGREAPENAGHAQGEAVAEGEPAGEAPVRNAAPEAETRVTEGAGAGEGVEGAGDRVGVSSDYQRRAAEVQQHIDALEATRDPVEFQQHVNELYRMANDREGDRAGSAADVYLHDPENGVTDQNLTTAARKFARTQMEQRTTFKASTATGGEGNPDLARGNMLPDEMRSPANSHTAQSMAQYLAGNAKDAGVRRVMQMVAGSGRDLSNVPLHFVRDGDEVPQHIQSELGSGHASAVTVTGDHPEVWVHDHAADEQTVAHEVLHAAFPDRLSNASPMGELMKEVRTRMQQRGMLDTPEGRFFAKAALQDPNEFKSYGFTSPSFRRMLAELDRPAERSLWQRFKDVIATALKMPAKWLDHIMDRNSDATGNPIQARMERALGTMLDNPDERSLASKVETWHQMAMTPSGAGEAIKDGALTAWGHLKALGNKVAFESIPTHAIADHFSDRYPALDAVVRAVDDRTAAQHTMARRAATVHDFINKAYKAADKSLDRFNEVMEDTQIAKVDPRDARALDGVQSKLMVAKEALDRANRMKGGSDVQKASARAEFRRAQSMARLDANWRKMSPQEKAAVGDSFDALHDSMVRRQKAADAILLANRDGFHDDAIDKLRADGAPQSEIDNQILRTYGRVFRGGQEPYAPLKRYGEWVTTASSKEYRTAEQTLRSARTDRAGEAAPGNVRGETADRLKAAEDHLRLLTQDPEHRIVEFHQSSVASQNRAAELRSAHPDMEVQRFARADYMQHAGALNGGLVNRIIEAVGEQLPDELRDNVGAVIREMYVDSLPDNAFDSSMAGRAGVAGYSTDFSRAVLDTLLRDSFNISTLEQSGHLGDAMKALDDQRRASGEDTGNNIYKAISKRIAFSTDHQNFRKWEQRISEVTHAFYLGMSPGFMLMNMMQMPMITMPMLYSRFGSHANGVMTKAIADVWDSVKGGNLDHEASARMTNNEKQVLTRLQNLGILNMTQLHDMATTARSSNIIDPQTVGQSVQKGWEISKDIANLPAQYVETVNRAASALAAYRLASEGRSRFGKMEHGAAMDYAGKVVRDSHVDYSAVNSAAWLKAPGGRFLFQFKKYWLSMLSMVSLNMYDAFGHGKDVTGLRNSLADSSLSAEDKAAKQEMLDRLLERRSVARRTLAGLYGSHMLLTGAQGMPFAGSAMALSSIMRNWYNDPEDKADTKTDIQNYLAGAIGVGPADAVMHGLFGALFGVNAQRISMGDLANPLGSGPASRTGAGDKDMLDQVLLGLMGPSVGLSQQIAGGMDQMTKGNYERGLEQMLPRAAGDVLKATRFVEDGSQQSPAGKNPIPTSNMDAIKEALGVMPETLANAYQARDATTAEKQQFTSTRDGMIDALAQARKTGGDTAAAQTAVDEFNQRNPDPQLRITMSDVLKAQNRIGKAPKEPSAREKAITVRTDRGAFAE